MAADLKQQIAAWFDGLSDRISVVSAEVIKMRAKISVSIPSNLPPWYPGFSFMLPPSQETSVEARMQLMQQCPGAPLSRPGKWARFRAALGRFLCCST